MKKISMKSVLVASKYILMLLVAGAIIYSLLVLPLMAKQDRLACHASALESAQSIVAQVEEANRNLAEGEEPSTVNDVVVYDTQYTICLRSKGL